MAKLTRSKSLSTLAEGEPMFTTGGGRFAIGITSQQSGFSWHLHLSEAEARDFADFVACTPALTH
jgi:hypothetical protein